MLTPLHQTKEAVEDFMDESDKFMFSEADVWECAKMVDEDLREVCLDHKIYDSIKIMSDTIMESI